MCVFALLLLLLHQKPSFSYFLPNENQMLLVMGYSKTIDYFFVSNDSWQKLLLYCNEFVRGEIEDLSKHTWSGYYCETTNMNGIEKQPNNILNGGTIVDHPHNDCISRLISHEFPPPNRITVYSRSLDKPWRIQQQKMTFLLRMSLTESYLICWKNDHLRPYFSSHNFSFWVTATRLKL